MIEGMIHTRSGKRAHVPTHARAPIKMASVLYKRIVRSSHLGKAPTLITFQTDDMHNAQALRHDNRNREVALSSKGYCILSKVAPGAFSAVNKPKEIATSAVVAFKVTKIRTHID